MHAVVSALVGALLGALVLVTSAFSLLRPLFMETIARDLPDEALRPGATKWEVVPPRGDLAPSTRGLANPYDPHRPVRLWLPLSDRLALAVLYDDPPCRISIEPARLAAPALPADCSEIEAMTTAPDGAIVLVGRRGVAHAAWRLPGLEATWVELAAPPATARGELVVGPDGTVYFGGFEDRIAAFDGAAWRELPPVAGHRYAFSMRVEGDGTIVLLGGQREEPPLVGSLFAMLPLAVLALVVTAALWARRRGAPLLPAVVGFVAVFAVGALGFVAMLPSLAWQ